MRAVDVDVDGEDGDKFFSQLPDLQGRAITFDELKHYLTQRIFYRVQAGRHYVALSLFEAECMRAVIHQQAGLSLIPGVDTTVALRTEKTTLDMTYGYEPAQGYQDQTAYSCFRFMDSQIAYQPRELSLLLRALQNNDCERRYNYFVEVRSNRRRKQKDPATTALSKVFITADEHHLLNYKIAAGRITALLKARGMFPRDCFSGKSIWEMGLSCLALPLCCCAYLLFHLTSRAMPLLSYRPRSRWLAEPRRFEAWP